MNKDWLSDLSWASPEEARWAFAPWKLNLKTKTL